MEGQGIWDFLRTCGLQQTRWGEQTSWKLWHPTCSCTKSGESYIGDPVEIWTKTCPSNAPAMRTHENCALLHSKCRPTQIPTNKCKQMQTNANKCKQASSTAKVLDSSQSLREFSTATFADSSSNVSDCKTRDVASCSHANSSQTYAACSPCSPSSLECAHFHRLSQYSPGSQNPL